MLPTLPCRSRARKVATVVRPQEIVSAILYLQSASTVACGALRCGRWVDTVALHSDNPVSRDMVLLRLPWLREPFHSSRWTGLVCLPQKPPPKSICPKLRGSVVCQG